MFTNESKEDYLERIYILKKENGFCRAIDIAKSMNYSKASISIALKKLVNEGFVYLDDVHNLFLTPSGEEIAIAIFNRHTTLAKALMVLGVDEKTAYSDACKIEHDLSKESFNAISKHLEKYQSN